MNAGLYENARNIIENIVKNQEDSLGWQSLSPLIFFANF